MSAPLAGLYLHIPFCARVCPYCDFAVRTGDRDRRRRFVDHLLQEIELYAGERRDAVAPGGEIEITITYGVLETSAGSANAMLPCWN